jgi:SAM-dependent methyltransferase
VANDQPSPAPLMRIASAFGITKTAAAALELDLFTTLSRGGTATADEIALRLGLARRPTIMLLTACAALGLLEREAEGFRNSPLAEAYLVPGRPHYFGDYLRLKDVRSYDSWRSLVDALRDDAPTTWDPNTQRSPYDNIPPDKASIFYSAMRSMSTYTATALAGAIDFAPVKNILDIGGGTGVYGIVLCRTFPHVYATVYDLPTVCPATRDAIDAAGLRDRITVTPGDFLVDDDLPSGHDLALLSAVLHNWDPNTGSRLLRKVYSALEPGGRVVICEQFVANDHTGPLEAALASLHMLVETAGGANYTEAEYRGWVEAAGFTDVEFVELDAAGANGALIGHKPR